MTTQITAAKETRAFVAGSHNSRTQLFGTCQPTGQLQTLEIVMHNVPIIQ